MSHKNIKNRKNRQESMSTAISLFDHFNVIVDVPVPIGENNKPTKLIYSARISENRKISNMPYEAYSVRRISLKNTKPHVKPLIESSVLASVRPPMPKYRPLLEPSIIIKGLLSEPQIESVIYAGQQHSQFFPLRFENVTIRTLTKNKHNVNRHDTEPTRVRSGYFIGDGTGVGKGRQVAAIIRDNWHQGRKRAVWISKNNDLINDARRDWCDIGGEKKDVIAWSKTPIGDNIDFNQGILFGTHAILRGVKYEYESKPNEPNPADVLEDAEFEVIDDEIQTTTKNLKSKNKRIRKAIIGTRIDQLVTALGKDFDGVIILDECHELGNADPVDLENDSASQPSMQGMAALQLQEALPNARFVYVSGTGASRIDGLTYAQRLGLWASDSAFISRRDFIIEMDKGGTSALEVVCRDLKALGKFCARTLSCEGIEYTRLVHTLSPEEITLWNTYNSVWRGIEYGFFYELLRLGGAVESDYEGALPKAIPGAAKTASSRLHSSKQRFYKQALNQISMPTVIKYMHKSLNEGKAIVLQLTNTNEAQLNRSLGEMNEDNTLDDLDLSQRDILVSFVRKNYPIHQYIQYFDDQNVAHAKIKMDEIGQPIEDPESIKRRDEIIATLDKLMFGENSLETLYREFSQYRVAEVTGRRNKIVFEKDPETGIQKRVIVSRPASENQRETEAFNNGPKDILVFSDQSGGTGRSFGADARFKNQKRRTHIILEMSWRAETAVQSIGRTNRANDTSAPEIVLVSTSVPGQARFSSSPARRIEALGALSRGSRDAIETGLFRPEDNLETVYAEEALRVLLKDIAGGRIPGITERDFIKQVGIRPDTKVINRGAHLTVDARTGFESVRMTKFLNRLLSCDIAEDGGLQGRLMESLMTRIEDRIAYAVANNQYDGGIETYLAKSIVIHNRQIINEDKISGATTELLTLHTEKYPNATKFDDAAHKLAFFERYIRMEISDIKTEAGFFLVGNDIELRIPSSFRLDAHSKPLVRVVKPGNEEMLTPKELSAGVEIPPENAQSYWTEAVKNLTPIKRTILAVHGALTPIWREIAWAKPTIYRMQTDEGERILGRILTKDEVQYALTQLEKRNNPEPKIAR